MPTGGPGRCNKPRCPRHPSLVSTTPPNRSCTTRPSYATNCFPTNADHQTRANHLASRHLALPTASSSRHPHEATQWGAVGCFFTRSPKPAESNGRLQTSLCPTCSMSGINGNPRWFMQIACHVQMCLLQIVLFSACAPSLIEADCELAWLAAFMSHTIRHENTPCRFHSVHRHGTRLACKHHWHHLLESSFAPSRYPRMSHVLVTTIVGKGDQRGGVRRSLSFWADCDYRAEPLPPGPQPGT